MKKVAILIPTYGRNDRLPDVVANARAATPGANIYLLMEPQEAVHLPYCQTLTRKEGFGTYAAAINYGYRRTKEPYLFAGADDLNFTPGWLEVAGPLMVPPVRIVGTNDLGNPDVLRQEHATHYLVDRAYLDAVGGTFDEGPGSFMPECYDHNYTDREFIDVARMRGVFAPCLDAVVEHCHVHFNKAPMDETYHKSFARADYDRVLYEERMRNARIQLAEGEAA